MSLKEDKRTFLAPGRSMDDSLHFVVSSTTLMRLYTRNQLSNFSRNSHSLPCLLNEAKRAFLAPGISMNDS